jgi:hypothetical protein
MLTLLFIFHASPEDCPHSLVAAPSASDRLLLRGCSEDVKFLSSDGPFDAVIIRQDHLQHDCDVLAKLKRLTPGTPVILLRDRDQRAAMKPTGIAFVCALDLGEKELVKSMWVFLRLILEKRYDCALRSRLTTGPSRYTQRCDQGH